MIVNGYVVEMSKVVPGRNFFSPGPDQDEIVFLIGTGTKNDWSRSCLICKQISERESVPVVKILDLFYLGKIYLVFDNRIELLLVWFVN